jgi:hypothetical protein
MFMNQWLSREEAIVVNARWGNGASSFGVHREVWVFGEHMVD